MTSGMAMPIPIAAGTTEALTRGRTDSTARLPPDVPPRRRTVKGRLRSMMLRPTVTASLQAAPMRVKPDKGEDDDPCVREVVIADLRCLAERLGFELVPLTSQRRSARLGGWRLGR